MLKAYEFHTTMETGHTLTMYLVFRTLVVDNDKQTATLLFQGYPSREERERQLSKGGGKCFEFSFSLSGSDYLALFTQLMSGMVGVAISDLVWQIALNTQFIADFAINEAGELTNYPKSLRDLNAVEIKLEMESSATAAAVERAKHLFA